MEQMSWKGRLLGHFVTRYSSVTIDVNRCSIVADSSSGDRVLFLLARGFCDHSVEIRWKKFCDFDINFIN